MPRKVGSGTSEASKANLAKARLRKELNNIIQKVSSEADPTKKLDSIKEANVVSDMIGEKHHFSEADIEAVKAEIAEFKKGVYKEIKEERKKEKVKKEIEVPEPIAPKKAARPKAAAKAKAQKKRVGNVAEVLDGEAEVARVVVNREELTKRIIDNYEKELKDTRDKVDALSKIVEKYKK